MRRFAVLLLLAAAAALLPASKADAYKLFKHRWYSKTLTYYDATGGAVQGRDPRGGLGAQPQRRADQGAVGVAAQRARAHQHQPQSARRAAGCRRATRSTAGSCAARASCCAQTSGRAGRRRQRRRWRRSPCVAHEMAHVLGLDHEDRRCATMNSGPVVALQPAVGSPGCTAAGSSRRDDVRGLVRRFGGRVKSVGQELCEAEPAPAAPLGLAATPDANGRASPWAGPRAPVPLVRTEVLRKAGGCPTGTEDTTATLIARIDSGPGQAKSIPDLPPGPGSYCYAVVGSGRSGGLGSSARRRSTTCGRPDARTSPRPGPTRRRTQLRLTDASTDPDGQIVAWSVELRRRHDVDRAQPAAEDLDAGRASTRSRSPSPTTRGQSGQQRRRRSRSRAVRTGERSRTSILRRCASPFPTAPSVNFPTAPPEPTSPPTSARASPGPRWPSASSTATRRRSGTGRPTTTGGSSTSTSRSPTASRSRSSPPRRATATR